MLLTRTEKMELKTNIPELNNFKAWYKINDSIKFGQPIRCPKNWEYLQSTLDSGLMEIVPHQPEYTKNVHTTPEFIAENVWLRPTQIGLFCHQLWLLLEKEKAATKNAYEQGKLDAISILTSNMCKLTNVNFANLEEYDD